MSDIPSLEVEMTRPTMKLFPRAEYHRLEQVSFGRKSIDIVCVKKNEPFTVAIELKICNWRQALWQASVNLQVANESYIAIWNSFVHRAEKQRELLEWYGVGLISVSKHSAKIILPPSKPVKRRIAKSQKKEWYEILLKAN